FHVTGVQTCALPISSTSAKYLAALVHVSSGPWSRAKRSSSTCPPPDPPEPPDPPDVPCVEVPPEPDPPEPPDEPLPKDPEPHAASRESTSVIAITAAANFLIFILSVTSLLMSTPCRILPRNAFSEL